MTQDTHHEPLSPDMYIRYRMDHMIQFYKRRIPSYNHVKMISNVLTILKTIAVGALTYYGMTSWTAVVSIFTAAITAYMEFNGMCDKISRYSFTVHSLKELKVWWETLTPTEQSVLSNIDLLILSAEDLIQREQTAWRSSSQAAK